MSLFAIAVLVATVLFAHRLGPAEELHRRFYQVGLAFAAVLFVLALAAVVVPVPNGESLEGSFSNVNEGGGGVFRERLSIAVAGGLLLLLAGLYQARAYVTVAVGFILAGVILLVSSAVDAGATNALTLLYSDGGEARNAVYAAVTGIALAVLLAYGLREWALPAQAMEPEDEAAI